MDYGKAIRLARAGRRLTQKRLAALTGLDSSYISLLESNRRVPSTTTLEVLARKLGIPIYLLMLLASDQDDLHGISRAHADVLGTQLLGIVTGAQTSARQASRKR